jgi:hypothetical protein
MPAADLHRDVKRWLCWSATARRFVGFLAHSPEIEAAARCSPGMVCTLRFVVPIILVLLCSIVSVHHARSAEALERGTAIVDPLALRELDGGRFALGRMMQAKADDAPLTNQQLFALPSMINVRRALDAEFDKYIVRHKAELPGESIGVGYFYDFQMFDRSLLVSPDTRFVLAGIVNRMDRAYVREGSCGEIRLIYRLTRTDMPQAREGGSSSRLPMTLNIVLKARGDQTSDGKALSCAEIARRWLAAGDLPQTGSALVQNLTAVDGPLALIRPEDIYRIETNLQIAHAPKSEVRDFRTDYLMKVFDFDPGARAFEEERLENELDRDRILTDANLGREFKAWLLDPRHFAELDRGTIVIPEKFLAVAAIAPTPIGFSNSSLQPAFGLVQGDEAAPAEPLFREQDVVTALKKAAERGIALSNIRSVAGFERRLNDVSCAGCHQTRGIGGFHFPGVDWMAAKPDNSRVVPASPHFFGDQTRRRDILASFRNEKRPDFSRGFSSRPQSRGNAELAGTEYEDGWGAHCYVRHASAAENDKSFSSWTCAKGLACKPPGNEIRMGMCFVK